MKDFYDFSKGKRGAIIPLPEDQVEIRIRIDKDILEFLKDETSRAGGCSARGYINDALRVYVQGRKEAERVARLLREERIRERALERRRRRLAKKKS